MGLLVLDHLCAAPWGKPLLQDIHFTLRAGEVLGLIGANGAGKSSLLHCIAGSVAPASGRMAFAGRPLQDWTGTERARALAMQTQHSALSFPFTVEEVVLLGRIPHASGAKQDAAIVEEVLLATDTATLRQRPYTQLSGGERQRVQLARAVAQLWRAQDAEHRLLLLDEPSAALDLAHQQMVMDVVLRLAADDCAVILASHDFNLLSARADQMLVLQGGRQHSAGRPAEVLTPAMFREVFQVDVILQPHPENRAPLVIQR